MENTKLEKDEVKNMVSNIKNCKLYEKVVSTDYNKNSNLTSEDKFYECAKLYQNIIKEYNILLEQDNTKIETAINNLIKTDEENQKMTENTASK